MILNNKKSKYTIVKLIIYIIFLILYINSYHMNVPTYYLLANAEETFDYDMELNIDYPRPSDSSVLEKGSKSSEVYWLQTALNMAIDANLEVDGNFGEKTKSAVIEFQNQYGLTADGIADRQTIQKLTEILSADTEISIEEENSTVEEQAESAPEKKKYKFTEYCKYYYKCSKDLFFNFTQLKNEITSKSLLPEILIVWGTIEIGLIICVFLWFSKSEIWVWRTYHYPGIMESFEPYETSIPFTKYIIDLGGGIKSILLFLILNLLLSPLISDIYFLRTYFNLGLGISILKSVFYLILRLAISIAGLFIFTVLILILIGLIITIVSLPIMLIMLIINKIFSKNEDKEENDDKLSLTSIFLYPALNVITNTITMVFSIILSCIIDIIIHLIPIIMVLSVIE